jgi:hypothetical protein
MMPTGVVLKRLRLSGALATAMICFVASITGGTAATAGQYLVNGTSGASSYSPLVVAHELRNLSHQNVVAWTVGGGRIAIAYQGFADAGVIIDRNSLTYWSDGQRHEVIRFHEGGLWSTVRIRFGLTHRMVRAALRSHRFVAISSPFRRTLAASPTSVPPVMSAVDDYGQDVSRLAKAAPFAVHYLGPAALGNSYARGFISTDTNPYARGPYKAPSVSGPIVTLIYSSNPSRLGTDDREVTLTLSTDTGHAGQANAAFLSGHRRLAKTNGIVAFEANSNQIVFRLGHVIAVATSTVQPTDAQWGSLLVGVRTP